MKFLVDENLPDAVVTELSAKGFDVLKVSSGSFDTEVIALATKERRVLLTLDKDFADILTYPPQAYSGIICFRIKRPVVTDIVQMLNTVLLHFKNSSLEGKLVVVTPKGFRIR